MVESQISFSCLALAVYFCREAFQIDAVRRTRSVAPTASAHLARSSRMAGWTCLAKALAEVFADPILMAGPPAALRRASARSGDV